MEGWRSAPKGPTPGQDWRSDPTSQEGKPPGLRSEGVRYLLTGSNQRRSGFPEVAVRQQVWAPNHALRLQGLCLVPSSITQMQVPVEEPRPQGHHGRWRSHHAREASCSLNVILTLQVVSLAFECSEAPDPCGPLRSVSTIAHTGESTTPADAFCDRKQGHRSVCPHIIK